MSSRTEPRSSPSRSTPEVREAVVRLLQDSLASPGQELEDDATLGSLGLEGLSWVHFADRFRDRFGHDPARLGNPSQITLDHLVTVVKEGVWWRYPAPPRGSAADLARSDFFPRLMRPLLQLVFRAIMRVAWSLRVDGRGRIPKKGPFVLVSNHAGHPDAPVLMASLRLGRVNSVHPLAAQDYFFKRRWIGALVHLFLNALPIDRSQRAPEALKDALDLLASGRGVILFPEGTRSTTGEIGSFRRGVGLLLAGKKHPAIPAYIEGSHKVLPKGAKRPHRHPLCVRIGEPVDFAHLPDTPESWQEIAQDLEDRVKGLAIEAAAASGEGHDA